MLSFGVPLEDVFPLGEIHTSLKNCFKQMYEVVAKNSLSVEDALRLQGTTQELLFLKEKLINCEDITRDGFAPGSFLWAIRHFIGLLPLPLLPGKEWIKITKLCKQALISCQTGAKNNKTLIPTIAKQLKILPSPNFLLISTLFNYMRMLAALPNGEPKINKIAAFALVKYFSPSLHVKPFQPGCVKKIDQQYYPLSLYLILKWPQIRNICIKTTSYRFQLPIEEIYPGFKKYPLSKEPYYLYKKRAHITTQTHSPFKAPETLSDMEVRIVPPWYDTCDYLQDVACQTDNSDASETKIESMQKILRDCCCGFPKTPVEERQTRVVFLSGKCCCTYGSHYLSDVQRKPAVSEDGSEISEEVLNFLSSVDEQESNEDLEALLQYDDIEVFDPIKKGPANDLFEENSSKVALSHASSLNQELVQVEDIGWNVKSDNEFCNTIRKSLNKELKEKFNQNQSEIDLSSKEDFQTCLSNVKINDSQINLSPQTIDKKSKSSINKMKSRLEFLKIFTPKKESRKCSSYERVDSKIRYKKIGSVNSIL